MEKKHTNDKKHNLSERSKNLKLIFAETIQEKMQTYMVENVWHKKKQKASCFSANYYVVQHMEFFKQNKQLYSFQIFK